MRDDAIFSSQVLIHMASTIDDQMMWIPKISYENVTKIKSFQIKQKNDYANNMEKMTYHYIHNVIIKIL
jgi:hypothetical protein